MVTQADPLFELFGVAHVLTMLIILFVSIALPITMRRFGSPKSERAGSAILGYLLLTLGVFKIWLYIGYYGQPLAPTLPLHLCNAAVFLTAFVLIRRSYAAYEVMYFWCLGGSVPALLTPDLLLGFPSLAYLTFFFSHGLKPPEQIVLAVLECCRRNSPIGA